MFSSRFLYRSSSTMPATVAELITQHKVVVFSWVHCPYCSRAKEILKSLAKDIQVYECDQMDNGEELRTQILQAYNHDTVPAIFINGEFIGGCSDLQAIQKSGELAAKLA
ncbi:glutaredoxin-like protein [Leishmania major strain Friedlin]|uniref:Glutaredoxin-like protein n=1 Tax=Leishmania major TaxID=5664 RepID=E9AD58_LEIMA|nr:glutaredoxin-like protein [Leishmania major strain Friedlin]CAG9576682.1 glutaredoxin-like_protein [Leishmania major strain Friedlin]CBZ12142.1 glutaredoxin-like protein [Leishmania major strain Friedlin]|eukprot:XP_003721887.1 glutaredoxin-like protein [Leishmania major strain Friedlin]